MVTGLEIEEQIVELHKAKKSSREISNAVRKNYTFIGAVLKKRFPEEYPSSDIENETKETRALRLFSLGKTAIQVAITLNEEPKSVEKYLEHFWRLRRMDLLYDLYRENKKTLPALLSLVERLRKRGIIPLPHKELDFLMDKIDAVMSPDSVISLVDPSEDSL